MATVQLSDIIDVVVFQDLPAVNGVEKSALFRSGIVTQTPLLNQLAQADGKIAELPFWNDLDASGEPNYSTGDPTDVALADKIAQGEQIARKAFVNNGWSASNLASELAAGDLAMEHIKSRVDAYFTKQWQKRLIASMNGILADNVANYSGDMVWDVAAESIALQLPETKLSRDNIIEAIFTLGDSFDDVTAIGMHSQMMKQAAINDDIDYIRDSQGNVVSTTYLGKPIIVDDNLPVVAGGTDGFKYTTVLFGAGAIGYGEGFPVNPVGVQMDEDQGEGAGVETLWVRKTWLLHPAGFQSTVTPAAVSATLTELAAATSWDRVVDRKNVPLAFMITN
ncbi:MAG: phage coat protein [Deltaproteobacteria bacterium]|nr:MAG: phage coat protein [Deltaproteobacteria bacterium]